MSADRVISQAELAKHNTADDGWMAINGYVLDVSKFAKFHPGGAELLREHLGKDVTELFYELHRESVFTKYLPRLKIGTLAGAKVLEAPPLHALSQVPYAEASYWQNWKSPYYKKSHDAFRAELRAFVRKEIAPFVEAWEEKGVEPSTSVYRKLGSSGMLAARIGPGKHLKVWGGRLPGGVRPEEFDYFHELIAHEEINNLGTPGVQDGMGAGMVIGLPPVLNFGASLGEARQEQILKEVLSGEKRICLAISEPFAGSDVANIKCTAKRTPDGKHFVVNGVKKWITNGTFSDYFVTAVRTGGKGVGGITLLLIERGPGVETKKIITSYSPAAGTAYITFENVLVPVENILGKENQGFRCIMYNFNHERWLIVVGVVRATRLVVEECLKWVHQRKVFGKTLAEQPAIRQKLGFMVAQVEGVQNWLENVTYQMNNMTYAEQSRHLAGPIALLKLLSTRVALAVSDEACQIFGGRAITRSGMGQVIERFQRSIKYGAILGGSEEIMADLGVRQAMKYFPANAKL